MSTTIALIATRPHAYKDPHLNSPLIIGSTGILACAVYLVQCEHKDSVSRSHRDENLFTISILIR